MIEKKPIGFQSYRDFRHQFETEPVYTRAELAQFLEQNTKEMTVNRIIKKGKDSDIAMRILSIHRTPDGILIYVD